MTTFDRREEAFENLFAHDEEIRFKAEARRARLVAEWAGHKLGKTGADFDVYVAGIVDATVATPGAGALAQRVKGDLHAAGLTDLDAAVHERMATFMAEALVHVKTA